MCLNRIIITSFPLHSLIIYEAQDVATRHELLSDSPPFTSMAELKESSRVWLCKLMFIPNINLKSFLSFKRNWKNILVERMKVMGDQICKIPSLNTAPTARTHVQPNVHWCPRHYIPLHFKLVSFVNFLLGLFYRK